MSTHKVKVDPTDNKNKTPLHLAVEQKDREVINILLRHNADVNAQMLNGNTSLSVCVDITMPAKIDKEIVKMLIKSGADVNICNKKETSPLHIAASRYDAN